MAKGIALWRNTTTAEQSVCGDPVAAFVSRNIFGQAKGNISLGSVQSKTILCLPLTPLNHSSGSAAFPEKALILSFALRGFTSEATPIRAAAPVTFPKKSRLFAGFIFD